MASESLLPFKVSNTIANDPERLIKRASEDGYLFFSGLLPAEDILEVRREILGVCGRHGWLADGSAPMDGIARPGVRHIEGEPGFATLYDDLQRIYVFHALAHSGHLMKIPDALFDGETLVHARNIARIIFPDALQHTTPAHQDYVHIQGTPDTWTAWIPLGDCPRTMGSLAVLPGSHRNGIYPTHSAYGAGGLGIDTDEIGTDWAASDFRLGDVLLFHSLLVHKALPNTDPSHLRLSVDYRYQSRSEPVVESSFLPHHNRLGWEEVYAGWPPDSPLKYYWRDLPLRFAEWTPKHHQT